MNGNVKAAAQEEWFDVVNARDEVTGRARRAEVHARGWRHRAVLVFVFNAAGEVFLQKRSMSKDVSPGLWTLSCSGHVDAGEDYDTAARRELSEELGWWRPQPPARWLRVEASVETDWEFSWIYRMTAEGPFTLHPGEIETGEWTAIAALNRRMVAQPEIYCPGFRWIWSLVAPKLGV
ncbi:MAG: NUDIX domain-containing protein [Opitutaceae bacterium]|nr:NUDIX domain-containing protein [Opitutaceae bacterium]